MRLLTPTPGCSTNTQVFNDTNDTNDFPTGVTPLYVAVSIYTDVEEFEEVLQCLIDGGCQLDTPVYASSSVDTETSLYRALDVDKADFATILLQHGADVDVECPHGVTILNKVEFLSRLNATESSPIHVTPSVSYCRFWR